MCSLVVKEIRSVTYWEKGKGGGRKGGRGAGGREQTAVAAYSRALPPHPPQRQCVT